MTQFNHPEYDIERPTGTCAFTGRTLEPGETYMATLVEVPLDEQADNAGGPRTTSAAKNLGLHRLDVSMEAWEQGKRPDHLFSYWRTTVPQPTEKKKLFVDDAVLMNLFRRLEATEDEKRLAFRFVLGLILMRKKLLRYDGTERRPASEGEAAAREWWLMTPKLDVAKGPMGKWDEDNRLSMLDPHLDESQIEQVSQQLGEILEGEL